MEEYRSVLPEVRSLILNNKCIIIGGDSNTDFERKCSNVTLLKSLIDSENLRVTLGHEVNNVHFTFRSKTNLYQSHIDYFLVNESLLQHVNVYKSHHDCDNFSDHCPISITFNINANYLIHVGSSYVEKVCWKHANCADLCNYK